jgi:hypothetical protein
MDYQMCGENTLSFCVPSIQQHFCPQSEAKLGKYEVKYRLPFFFFLSGNLSDTQACGRASGVSNCSIWPIVEGEADCHRRPCCCCRKTTTPGA